ncbi:hypothetical protein L1987_58065 [Smallanthus sonchifolius]|uniref:Uncharacterized protein n=1 Tax=Smallanthus sonchifolius TaxID=185202 RepID=A0ACB9DER9_9ASTR|nr:hypothetical protein L1987_58065 [Smallanthus sonchifolius]
MSSRRPPVGVWQTTGGKNRKEQWKNQQQLDLWSWGRMVTSFYVANFPEGTKAVDLKICFGEYGKVVDSYVAAKKDKAWSLFSFVRFDGVKDKISMEQQLILVFLNNARLSVNLSKFNKEGKPNNAEGYVGFPSLHSHRMVSQGTRAEVPWEKSYRNALLRGQSHQSSVSELALPNDEDGIDWVQEWIGRPESSQSDGRRAAQAVVRGNHSNSNDVGVEETPLQGNNTCMGNSMNIDENVGAKKLSRAFEFAAGKSGDSQAHLNQDSTNIEDMDQKINVAIGLNSRKRPRLGSIDDDPFNLDQIIGVVNQPRTH